MGTGDSICGNKCCFPIQWTVRKTGSTVLFHDRNLRVVEYAASKHESLVDSDVSTRRVAITEDSKSVVLAAAEFISTPALEFRLPESLQFTVFYVEVHEKVPNINPISADFLIFTDSSVQRYQRN